MEMVNLHHQHCISVSSSNTSYSICDEHHSAVSSFTSQASVLTTDHPDIFPV